MSERTVSRERPSWATRVSPLPGQALWWAFPWPSLPKCPTGVPGAAGEADRLWPGGGGWGRYLHVAVEAEGRHEDPVHVAEGRGALLLPVDEEGQCVFIQVQQHTHSGPLAHATFRPRGERPQGKPSPLPAWDTGGGSGKLPEGCQERPHLKHTAPRWCRELLSWACDPSSEAHPPVKGLHGKTFPSGKAPHPKGTRVCSPFFPDCV